NAERERLAGADQACRLDDILRRDVIERADVIVFAPATPVLELSGRFRDGCPADLDIHRTLPFPWCEIIPQRSGGRRRVQQQFGINLLHGAMRRWSMPPVRRY